VVRLGAEKARDQGEGNGATRPVKHEGRTGAVPAFPCPCWNSAEFPFFEENETSERGLLEAATLELL
jgi:hypothetical protein